MPGEVSKSDTAAPRAISNVGPALVMASALASTFGIVFAQFLDDLGDGILAEMLGGQGVLFNNRTEISGVSDVALGGGFALCLLIGLFLLFAYPTARDQGTSRLVMLWILLHVLRQALTQAVFLPFDPDGQLARAYATFDLPAGLDLVIAAAGGVGLLLVALSAASAFLAFTPQRRIVSTPMRFNFAVWIVLIPAVASAFLALPFFLPDSESMVIRSLPLTPLIFLATVAAAPGTSSVHGPEDRRSTPWPWALLAALLGLLLIHLVILQGGVEVDPRRWG
ncbi:MAG: hypothetical protein ACRDVL_02440 [Acidimicrobiia bacterium]